MLHPKLFSFLPKPIACRALGPLLTKYVEAESSLTDAERDAVNHHLMGCPSCQDEVAALSAIGLLLRKRGPAAMPAVEPAADLWSRIEAQMDAEEVSAPARVPAIVPVKAPRRGPILIYAPAFAALVVGVVVVPRLVLQPAAKHKASVAVAPAAPASGAFVNKSDKNKKVMLATAASPPSLEDAARMSGTVSETWDKADTAGQESYSDGAVYASNRSPASGVLALKAPAGAVKGTYHLNEPKPSAAAVAKAKEVAVAKAKLQAQEALEKMMVASADTVHPKPQITTVDRFKVERLADDLDSQHRNFFAANSTDTFASAAAGRKKGDSPVVTYSLKVAATNTSKGFAIDSVNSTPVKPLDGVIEIYDVAAAPPTVSLGASSPTPHAVQPGLFGVPTANSHAGTIVIVSTDKGTGVSTTASAANNSSPAEQLNRVRQRRGLFGGYSVATAAMLPASNNRSNGSGSGTGSPW